MVMGPPHAAGRHTVCGPTAGAAAGRGFRDDRGAARRADAPSCFAFTKHDAPQNFRTTHRAGLSPSGRRNSSPQHAHVFTSGSGPSWRAALRRAPR